MKKGWTANLPIGIVTRIARTPRTSNNGAVLLLKTPDSASSSPTSSPCRGYAETVRAVRGTSNTSCAIPSVPGWAMYSGPRKVILASVSEICKGGGRLLPALLVGAGKCRWRLNVTWRPVVYRERCMRTRRLQQRKNAPSLQSDSSLGARCKRSRLPPACLQGHGPVSRSCHLHRQ
jgi:hypothetical protein